MMQKKWRVVARQSLATQRRASDRSEENVQHARSRIVLRTPVW